MDLPQLEDCLNTYPRSRPKGRERSGPPHPQRSDEMSETPEAPKKFNAEKNKSHPQFWSFGYALVMGLFVVGAAELFAPSRAIIWKLLPDLAAVSNPGVY